MSTDHAAAARDDDPHRSGPDIFAAGREAERAGRFSEARHAYEAAVAACPVVPTGTTGWGASA